MTSPLRLDTDDRGVTTLTLDRPKRRNALDEVLVRQTARALEEAARDPATHVIVLTGTGDAFCSGMDLYQTRALQDADASVNMAYANSLSAICTITALQFRRPKSMLSSTFLIDSGGRRTPRVNVGREPADSRWNLQPLCLHWTEIAVPPS